MIVVFVNISLSEGAFPDLLKVANVCSIFKKKEAYKCIEILVDYIARIIE